MAFESSSSCSHFLIHFFGLLDYCKHNRIICTEFCLQNTANLKQLNAEFYHSATGIKTLFSVRLNTFCACYWKVVIQNWKLSRNLNLHIWANLWFSKFFLIRMIIWNYFSFPQMSHFSHFTVTKGLALCFFAIMYKKMNLEHEVSLTILNVYRSSLKRIGGDVFRLWRNYLQKALHFHKNVFIRL